jgi:thiamine-monophosphate kinase
MSQREKDPRVPGDDLTLGDLGEADILRSVLARFRTGPGEAPGVLVGPGDDTALLGTSGAVLATTDTVVRDRDWRDEWSTGHDVGTKVVVQNLADIAAMGGVGTGLLVTLVAPAGTSVRWVEDLTEGIAEAAAAERVPVLGGDLSSTYGPVMVSVTALGELPGSGPVLRSGARPGQVLAVHGSLGWSMAGLELLRRGWEPGTGEDAGVRFVTYHRRPAPDLAAGPAAAAAGATAMIDVSDGLVRDAGRVAAASGVRIVLDEEAIRKRADAIAGILDDDVALDCVLRGGEEHGMLATFSPGVVDALPGWSAVGHVEDGEGVSYRGERLSGGGWDHFGG